MAADPWLSSEACCVALGWSQLPSAPASCSSTSAWASLQVRRKRFLLTHTWSSFLMAWASSFGLKVMGIWWHKGGRGLLACWLQLSFGTKSVPSLAPCPWLTIACRDVFFAAECCQPAAMVRMATQLLLKSMQADCALPRVQMYLWRTHPCSDGIVC